MSKYARQYCNEGGECIFSKDMEYDPTGKTINCEKCGQLPGQGIPVEARKSNLGVITRTMKSKLKPAITTASKRGRPALPDGGKLIAVNVKVSPDENEAAINRARSESESSGVTVSRSKIFRKALRIYLGLQKGGK